MSKILPLLIAAKAFIAALSAALTAAVAVIPPNGLDAGSILFVVATGLAAFVATYAVPNRPPSV